MSAVEPLPSFSFEEFLKLEQVGQDRHEWVAGRVYVMAGGTERHALLSQMLFRLLDDAAEAEGCRAFVADRMLRTAEAAYYPDVMVTCGPAENQHYETDATWVVEVLSPSTQTADRREKAATYATLPSLRGYLLADPQDRTLVVGRNDSPGGWTWTAYLRGSTMSFGGVEIDVDLLWTRLDARASLP